MLGEIDYTSVNKYVQKVADKSRREWLTTSYLRIKNMPKAGKDVREAAIDNFWVFMQLMNPHFYYADVHREIAEWLQEYSLYGMDALASSDKCLMLPRGHLKSHIAANFAAWLIVRHPNLTSIYMSATIDLSIEQLHAIKNILTSANFTKYFPEYVHPDEGKRSKWSEERMSIDHIVRDMKMIRDNTVRAASVQTNIIGLHCDAIFADDLVTDKNSATPDERQKVSNKVALFTSVRNTGGMTLACGTRYHPQDEYSKWKEMSYELYDEDEEVIGEKDIWEFFERRVETENKFLWPRGQAPDGSLHGFDMNELSKYRANYRENMLQFNAQYYNDPSDPSSVVIDENHFQYLNPKLLNNENGYWKYKGRRLNIFASIDFAYSISKRADYTALVVIGMDSDKNIYVLDIDRFKTNKYNEYVEHIVRMHRRWGFRKLRAEVVAAQRTIVEYIKDYAKQNYVKIKVEDFVPPKHQSKETRISAALDYKYENFEVFHADIPLMRDLEDELTQARPKHDDIKDALAAAVEFATPPAREDRESHYLGVNSGSQDKGFARSRFGGGSSTNSYKLY